MRLFTTEIKAIYPETGELCTWAGPNIPAISFNDAQEYCNNNGLGYCKVVGILNSEIPVIRNKDGTITPDFANRIDYHNDN